MLKIDDIKVGDGVVFHSTKSQSNHDEYWTVTGKHGSKIFIELNKFGINETWTIDIEDVAGHIPLSRLTK